MVSYGVRFETGFDNLMQPGVLGGGSSLSGVPNGANMEGGRPEKYPIPDNACEDKGNQCRVDISIDGGMANVSLKLTMSPLDKGKPMVAGVGLSAFTQSAIWPTNYQKVTSGYSLTRTDPVTRKTAEPHTVIDIKNPIGGPVYSILDGRVVEVNSSAEAGNYIKVDHGGGLETSYSHTGSTVKAGQTVIRGQTIGASDGSGRIHGPHLHFVVRLNGLRVQPCKVVTCQ